MTNFELYYMMLGITSIVILVVVVVCFVVYYVSERRSLLRTRKDLNELLKNWKG